MLTYRFFEAERSADRSEPAFDWPEGRGPRGGQGKAVQCLGMSVTSRNALLWLVVGLTNRFDLELF